MKIELELGNPILKCYQKGRVMTMMLSQNKCALPWIYYNNLQICCHKINDKGEEFVIDVCNPVAPFLTKEWDACPYIRDNSYSIERVLEKNSSIVNYLIDCLNHREYTYFCLNTSYVSAYNKKKYPPNIMHDIFICGYDDMNKYFIGYDYFDDAYEKKNIPFNEIEKAILEINSCVGIKDYVNGIHSFLLQECYVFSHFKADYLNLYHMLDKMYEIIIPELSEASKLMSRRTEGLNMNFFGIKVYDELCIYLKSVKMDSNFDYRPFYVIKDHLQILHDTIQFFDMPLHEESKELLKSGNVLTAMALKAFINYSPSLIEILQNNVIKIKKMELQLITNLLQKFDYNL